MGLSWLLANRFRQGSKGRGFLSFIATSSTVGIVLGCSVLIAALSMMNGFQQVLQERLLKVVPHVEYQRVEGVFDDWRALAAIAERDPAVHSVQPVIRQTGMVQYGRHFKGIVVQGIEPMAQHLGVVDFIEPAAREALATTNDSVVLGAGLAEELSITVGDSVTLLVADEADQAFKSPQRHRLTVVGLFDFGGEIDHKNAYVSLQTARNLANLEHGVTGIQLVLNDVFAADVVASRVGNQLPTLVYVSHWMRTHGHLYRDIELVRTVMYLVLLLVMAVACFNIVSTLVLTVNKKQAQIAMLKTMGLSDTRVIRVFVWQGLQNGLKGTLIGSLIGCALALSLPQIFLMIEQVFSLQLLNDDVYFVSQIPSQLQWQDVALVTSVALVMSVLATIYPAWRATRVEPAKALHGNV